ncbi:OsmC family protein [Sporolactobacillus shoreicorticis]|uniref:OsmC family protein n=1 Tax=Sporolactobacillus shoreicorticis TaxID=1923877 RepID=A0ABW5S5A0_9BACL|nr:OsmC family protein [Sporolactobacillus shoreicorticis]MCO7126709.1 OsmC family protein [Sporolactobacillus shoreicorticis]
MTDFHFELNGSWSGSWDGEGKIQTNGLLSAISVDRAMSGKGVGTNPDELLISALASCYMITLGIRLKKEKVTYRHIEIQTKATVTKKGGLHFEKVTHYPTVYLTEPISDALTEHLNTCIHKAEQDCVIAKAVKGNVAISVEPTFIGEP